MICHELKTWPIFFRRLQDGTKTFEIRKNDRDFQTGDMLRLSEWDPELKAFTGQGIDFKISYVMDGEQFGVRSGYVIMGLGEWKISDLCSILRSLLHKSGKYSYRCRNYSESCQADPLQTRP